MKSRDYGFAATTTIETRPRILCAPFRAAPGRERSTRKSMAFQNLLSERCSFSRLEGACALAR
jgi:hypothetical protein